MCILTIFLGSALGSVLGIFLILFRGKSLQTRLAFGTLLGIASAILLFYGLAFLQWYSGSGAA